MPDDRTPKPLRAEKLSVLVIGLVLVTHSIFVALWVAPEGIARSLIGESSLEAYIDPYFQQSWQQFEPAAKSEDIRLSIRAKVADAQTGEPQTTPWIDLYQAEHSSTGRIDRAGGALAQELTEAIDRFNDEQREIVTKSFTEDTGKLAEQLRNASTTDAERDAVLRYLRADEMASTFASLYTRARFDGKLLEVQYRVGAREFPAFDKRDEAELNDVTPTFLEFGWRSDYFATASAQAAFDRYAAS